MATKLKFIDAESLEYKVIDKETFLVDRIFPFGLTIFFGSQKIGKSWLMLDLCCKVAAGEPFWGLDTVHCDVLYMCLEDTMARIQRRLFKLQDKFPSTLRITNEVHKVDGDLIEYLEDFIREFPNTGLIVIDTLQKVRSSSSENMYSHDYNDIGCLKLFADKHHIAMILVHHRRKQDDPDIHNTANGSNGLTGCADTTIALERANRTSDVGKLHITGRDIESQVVDLRFHDCHWQLVNLKTEKEGEPEEVPEVVLAVGCWFGMINQQEWKGTASEMCREVPLDGFDPAVVVKLLNQYHSTYLASVGIKYQTGRTHDGRYIQLTKVPVEPAVGARDGCDGCDGKNRIPPFSALTVTQPDTYTQVPPPADAPWPAAE